MISQLNAVAEILAGYSLGMLPEPGYITITTHSNGSSSVRFQVDSARDVIRWANAVDKRPLASSREDGNGIYTIFQVAFDHHLNGSRDGQPGSVMHVSVYYVTDTSEPVNVPV
jgi:hypothetical protein